MLFTKLLAAILPATFVGAGFLALAGRHDPAGAVVSAQYMDAVAAPAPPALLLLDQLKGWVALVSLGIAYSGTLSRTLDTLVGHLDWWLMHFRESAMRKRDPVDTLRVKAGAAPRRTEGDPVDDRPPV